MFHAHYLGRHSSAKLRASDFAAVVGSTSLGISSSRISLINDISRRNIAVRALMCSNIALTVYSMDI